MLTLQFHGHSCWHVDDGTHHVLIDPFLTGNPLADVGPDAFGKLDAVIVTHGHGDHLGDTVAIARRTGALVVSNYEIATWCGNQGCSAHGMNIGGGRSFTFGHVKFTIAHHGSTGPSGEPLANPMGVVLGMGGRKVYHAGDTGIFLDMQLIAELNGPFDAALLPIGDNFTMGIDDAVRATEFLGATVNIPMHYGTFEPIRVDATEFVAKVVARGGQAVIVEPGGSYRIA